MSLTRLLTIAALACCSLLALPAAGSAHSNTYVKTKLMHRGLDPAPRFPSQMPRRLARANVKFFNGASDYGVTWDLGCPPNEICRGYITLSRNPASNLWETIQSARARGGYAKKTWIGGTAAWHICGHHCGYLMKKDDRTYGVFGIYYRDLNSGHLAQDQRAILRRLRRL